MNKHAAFFLITVLCITFFGCDAMATLFHGEKPPDTWKVTFNANGASGAVPAAQTAETGAAIALPDQGDLRKAGSVFAGWSESPNGSGAVLSAGASVTVTRDITFYAQWLAQYDVIFNANGASGTAPEARNALTSGTVITLPDKGGLSKGTDIFGGWNESASGGGTTYSVGDSVTVTRNIVFYAQWLDGSTPQYTVTFNANGATSGAPPAPQTAYSGINIIVPGQGTLACSGKTFGGWNTQANGGGTNYAVGAAFAVTGNVTLYAKWQSAVQYTVTYNANGASGAAPAAQTVDPGTEMTLPGAGAMTYTGLIFDGWNTQANGGGTTFVEGAAYTVTVNTTFYAQWVSTPITPPGATFVEKLAYIRNNAGDGVVYDIVVDNNEYIGPQTVATLGRNITINIHSASSADIKSIQLESQGHLFSVDTNITLKLQDIALKGMSTNNVALVMIGQGGKLILNSGSKISLNGNGGDQCGGGIRINGGILELNEGSEISSNRVTGSSAYGGGIYVENKGNVTIRGGIITENSVDADRSWYGYGGGIYVTDNSMLAMSGGTISKNKANGFRSGGGGIFVSSGSFNKRAVSGSNTSGIIYGSTGSEANLLSSSYIVQGGNAIYRNFGTKQQRNTTLSYYDEITSLSDDGWE